MLSHGYPVVLDLCGADVLVVGGGRIAGRKTEALVAAGAAVTAVAVEFVDAFPSVAERHQRPYRSDDVAGRRLVITATGVPAVDGAVFADADAAGIWVNAADDPEHCTFILPAVLRHAPVTVAVSTGGASPALASALRDRIGEVVTADVTEAAATLAAERAAIHAAGESTEDADWRPRVAAVLAELDVRRRHAADRDPSAG